MKRVTFIYPYLTSYILPVLQGMVESGRVQLDVFYSPNPSGMGFGEHQPFEHPNVCWKQVKERHPLGDRFAMYQKDISNYIMKTRPNAIFIFANARYLSFWSVLIAGYLLNIPVYPWGHGLFKKKHIGYAHKLMFKAILALSHKYICYTPQVKISLLPLAKDDKKLVVGCNTLYNLYPIGPYGKTGKEKGILYIGRVRSGCGVDVLIETIALLNKKHDAGIELHVIGDGPLGSMIREKTSQLPWLYYYGKIFDQKKISEISRQCRFGCVPGFMGLNVVHMMSLSLPVVSHAQLSLHMGPEPEYIQHSVNGWLMEKPNDVASLVETLKGLWMMPADKFKVMQENAYKTYEELSNPPFHERILQILRI